MNKKRIQRLRALIEVKEKMALKPLATASNALFQAIDKVNLMERYQAEYTAYMNQKLREGSEVVKLHNTANFVHKLEENTKDVRSEIPELERAHDFAKQEYLNSKKRLDKTKQSLESKLAEQNKIKNKRELQEIIHQQVVRQDRHNMLDFK